jgi:hypothetical protein
MSTPTPTPTPRSFWTILVGDNGTDENPSVGIWTELGTISCPLLAAQTPPFECITGYTGENLQDQIYNPDYLARMDVISNWYYPEGLDDNSKYATYLDSITATFGPTASVPGNPEILLDPYLNIERGNPFLPTPTPSPSVTPTPTNS